MSEQNDLISRQDAIDAVVTKIKKWNAVDGEGYHVGLGLRYTDVIDMLTELPPAQQWIPCSERLPERGGSVLLCDLDGDIYLGHLATGCNYYYADYCDDRIKNVTAWQPLPEPYREESNDQ